MSDVVRITKLTDWYLLIATVTGPNSSLRLRFWRQLKSLGAAILRDGVYLLPQREDLFEALNAWRGELLAAGGNAYVLRQPAQDAEQQQEWIDLFDRREAYATWCADVAKFLGTLSALAENDARRQLRQYRKSLDAVVAIDYFGSNALEQAEEMWQAAETRLIRHYSPDEPVPASGSIPLLDRARFQARRWATRRRLWVDRVASAWLIRRFIDPKAEFVWLSDVRECPRDALGFDYDGATFTHIGNKVSFEVLMVSFGLDVDLALAKLATLVHALDLGTEASPEALGFEAILAGARNRINDDDMLLAEMSNTLDSLYAYFQGDANKNLADD